MFSQKKSHDAFFIRQRLTKKFAEGKIFENRERKFFCPKILKSDKIFRREKKDVGFRTFFKNCRLLDGEVLVIGIPKKRNASHKKQNHIVFVSMFRKF